MIVILDPAFFFFRPWDQANESDLRSDLRRMISFIKDTKARLVAGGEYWNPLWLELIKPLQSNYRNLDRDFAELRKLKTEEKLVPLRARHRVWGFRPMFDCPALPLGSVWADRMSRTVLQYASFSEEIVLYSKPVVGRNLIRHCAENSVIYESTRWRLYIQPRTANPLAVPCVNHIRHVALPWTARYDWRLPAEQDGARYPFCPPIQWWKRTVSAVKTVKSKPAFIDRRGSAWVRPNIPDGAGHHWDVFITNVALADKIGLNHVNIVEFGAPFDEGAPGTIHHFPERERGKVKDSGWDCN